MLGVNKVILVGNLGRDPELRRTPSGASVVSFSIATTERFNDKKGERQDRTEWHNIVAWGKLADLANQYLKKGRSVYIEGKLTTRSWDDKDGNKRYKTEIVANQIQFLGSPGESPAGDIPVNEYAGEDSVQSDAVLEPEPVVEDDLPF
jgi:single-strand DNA-binding protein